MPWAVLVLAIALIEPETALNPMVALGDFALLVLLQTVAPDSYAAVRFAALFLIAVHAHFQGELRGMAVERPRVRRPRDPRRHPRRRADRGRAARVLRDRLRARLPRHGLLDRPAANASESASRPQARGLSRRTIQAETEVRRRVAEAIHDGPVQDLIGLDMILSAANQAAAAGEAEKAAGLVDQARDLASRNVSCATRSSTWAPTRSRS